MNYPYDILLMKIPREKYFPIVLLGFPREKCLLVLSSLKGSVVMATTTSQTWFRDNIVEQLTLH